MDLNTAQMYTLAYFSSMIGMVVFLSIMLGFIVLIINLFKKLVETIFLKDDATDYD